MSYILLLFLLAFVKNVQSQGSSIERRHACWGSAGPPVVSAQCPRGTLVRVTTAGLKVQTNPGLCEFSNSDCGCEYGEAGCNMPDVQSECMGRAACRLDVMQQYINADECKGFSDYMYIEFTCVNKEQYQQEMEESNTLQSNKINQDIERNKNKLNKDSNLNTNIHRMGEIRRADDIPQRDQNNIGRHRTATQRQNNRVQTDYEDHQANAISTQMINNNEVDHDTNLESKEAPAPQINICTNSVESSHTGFIGSPALSSVDDIEQCHCSLITSPYSTISLTILHYQSSSCMYNALTVNTPHQTITLCEENSGTGSLDSKAHTIRLAFNANGNIASDGRFWLRYQALPSSPVKLQCKHTFVTSSQQPVIQSEEMHSDRINNNVDVISINEDIQPVLSKDVLVKKDGDTTSWWERFTAHTPSTANVVNKNNNIFGGKATDNDRKHVNTVYDLLTHQPSTVDTNSKATFQISKNSHLRNNLQQPYHFDRQINEVDNQKKRENNRKEPITATIIGACVIGSILLIVIVGIVVRFVLNRADPIHMLRQSHKKHCVVRKNTQNRGSRIFP